VIESYHSHLVISVLVQLIVLVSSSIACRTGALVAGDVTHTIAAAEEVYRLQRRSLWRAVVRPRASSHF
jgi:hypothetical protein